MLSASRAGRRHGLQTTIMAKNLNALSENDSPYQDKSVAWLSQYHSSEIPSAGRIRTWAIFSLSRKPHENRKRNRTYDNSDAIRDKSEDARTAPAAADTGFSLG